MKIALVNGSPKIKESTSELILNAVRQRLGDSHEFSICNTINSDKLHILDKLRDCNVIVVAFPLYVDGIPSHFLRLLDEIKGNMNAIAPGAIVFAISNNGFYEGCQNALALNMMESFCRCSGLKWGQGIGAGAGGMVNVASAGQGPMKNLGLVLDKLAENILNSCSGENQFIEPNFPRFLYKAAAHSGWKSQARKYGLKSKTLYDKRI